MKRELTKYKSNLPALGSGGYFQSLQREMNRLFEDFFETVPFEKRFNSTVSYPEVDVKETENDISISAELPGMEDKDIEVLISGDSLTIKGEKKQEKEEKDVNYHMIERRYGSFSRVIALPVEVDRTKADAEFKKGVLRITVPKTQKSDAKARKISIKTS